MKKEINDLLDNPKGKAMLFLSSRENARNDFHKIALKLTKENNFSGIMACFRNPAMMEQEHLKKEGVDIKKSYFIDGVTVAADFMPEQKNVFFTLNNKDLGGIKTGIDQFCSKDKEIKFILIDILDVLLYYNSIEKINELIESLKEKAKTKSIILLALVNKDNSLLFENIKKYFDFIYE